MMQNSDDQPLSLEDLWAGILSRDTTLILQVWKTLNQEERGHILQHLSRMAHEPGWAKQQRVSAQYALSALRERRATPYQAKRRKAD